jgi:hypothetical protein
LFEIQFAQHSPFNVSPPDFDEEYMLDLNNPLDNPDGILIVRGNNIVFNEEEYDTFVMLYPTWGDVREVTDEKYGMKACISKDGGSILVTKPRFPLFFKDRIKEMWAQEEEPYPQIVNSHKILINSIGRQAQADFHKTVLYRLMDGVKVKGGPFNTGDGLELDTELRFAPLVTGRTKNRTIRNAVPYAYWHICLDKPARVISKKKAAIDGNSICRQRWLC